MAPSLFDDDSDVEFQLDDDALDLTRNLSTNFLELSITATRNGNPSLFTSVSQFTAILAQTGIEGPWETKSRNLAERAVKIGEGAQFTVFKERPYYADFKAHPLVIKRVNVDFVRNGDGLFATSQEYRLHLRTLGLEVMALTNPSLRSHPNLVRLVAWGYDYPYADMPVPVLYVEAALMPLSRFLAVDSEYDCSVDVKYQLSLDIANGIEALHQLRIVHGDLKPDNVLVFCTQDDNVPFRAKLSDFGVCIDLETPDSPLAVSDYRGTLGWLAPEVVNETLARFCPFQPDLMFRFDAYSFGLTVVSIFANHGQPLADHPAETMSQLLSQDLPFAMRMKLRGIIQRLLAEDPRQRPLPSAELLKTDAPAYTSWLSLSQVDTGKTLNDIGMINPVYNRGPLFWQRSKNYIIKDLIKQYDKAKDGFPGSVLFGMAQAVTGYVPHVPGRFEAYLIDAAKKGYSPARAVYEQIMSARLHPLEYDLEVLEEWVYQAVSQGYLFARPSALTADRKEQALRKFRDNGGFCTDPFLKKTTVTEAARSAEGALLWIDRHGLVVDQKGNTILHAAAALGRAETVRVLLQSAKVSVDIENDDGETPLYKAAQAGHAEVIQLLIQWSADASRTTRQAKVSALHWLFMLPEISIPSIAAQLIAAGANVDSVIEPVVGENADGFPQRLDIFHYPFELPYGTPLHWAACFRNILAMETLINQGAQVDATYHDSDSGSRPLASATWLGDLEVVECLVKHGADPRLVDSKARNVLHSMTEESPTLHGFLPRPWHAWIRHGRWETYMHRVSKLVQLLVDAGTDINAKSKVYNGLTPIATAADPRAWDGTVIIALLDAGADIERATLSNGTSVLHSWAETWGDRLNYPCSYIPTFKRISTAMSSLDVRLSYDLGHKTPLHSLSHGHQPEVVVVVVVIFNAPGIARRTPNVPDLP
ncbi:ankyrin repeat and protein kinase domain-containing protein [Aspergillus mulundensis]|uniref:protein S-acyltransferase n=1 Tax=Aspergillus mulundensis TaxID=1810919 RepID=A0A3D8SUE7_9EURO|nr:hypothetical protein DSM5745_01704 [Aspergillus mulundensis]RDW89929.1 hypothetical protein DSM5745_01704 [Aspergillus mulundensis]